MELRARIDSPSLPRPFEVWYRLPPGAAPSAREERGDPFFALCLPLAMRLGETLEIERPLSPPLLDALPDISDIYMKFDARLKRGVVEAPAGEPKGASREPLARGTGVFFSLGVDSFYTLLKRNGPRSNPEGRVSDLLTVRGFDIPLDSSRDSLWRNVANNVETVARDFNLRAILAETNVRDLSDPIVPWGLYHGAAMAALALALQGTLGKVYVPSSASYARLHPWGTSPLLDPLWSTAEVEVVHDGCEANRLQKVAAIKDSALALGLLRVCFLSGDSAYNCGRCEKCVRTLICLLAAGALGHCKTLPSQLDLARVGTLVEPDLTTVARYEELLGFLGTSPRESEVREVLERSLAMAYARLARTTFRRTRAGSRLDRVLTPLWRTLKRFGNLFRW